MVAFLIITVSAILFGAFLYWAYLPDYKRDPKEFKRTLIGMPIGLLMSYLGLRHFNEKIRKWAIEKTEKKIKDQQYGTKS